MAWMVARKKGIYASLAKALTNTSRSTVVPCPKFRLEEKLRLLSASLGQIKGKLLLLDVKDIVCARGRNHYLQPLTYERFCTTSADKTSEKDNEETEIISVTFVDKDGEEKHIKVPVGMSMLEAAHENDVELEGACEGSLACSTCHVIVMDVDYYNKLEDPTDEENDMLDLAFGLTDTSRLGCQIIANPKIDGIRLALPTATRNFAVDGYKPKPH